MMSKLSSIGLFLCFIAIGNNTYATTGCLIGSSLYTSSNGTGSGKIYYDTSPSINASGFCLRNGTTTSPCQLRTWYWFFWSYGDNGVSGDFGPSNPPTYCPIDDYVWLMLLGFGAIGYVFVRKKMQLIPV